MCDPVSTEITNIPNQHERYYQLGKKYWWFYGKYRLVLGLLKQYFPLLPEAPWKIFDAGCGPGHFMELLQNYGEVTGTDFSLERLRACRQENFQNLAQTDLCFIPFKENTFDLITTIDTIEHIENDQAALDELYRVLKPGGLIAVTVPAFMILWGSHDENQGHCRRYRLEQMQEIMESAGFTILKSSYAEFLWFFPLLILRKIKALKDCFFPSPPSDDFAILPNWINSILTATIVYELPFLKLFNLPLGVTMVVIGMKRKPDQLESLRQDIALGIEQADHGELIEGSTVFRQLRERNQK